MANLPEQPARPDRTGSMGNPFDRLQEIKPDHKTGLVLIQGASVDEILAGLDRLENRTGQAKDLEDLVAVNRLDRGLTGGGLTLSLVAETPPELVQEIQHARLSMGRIHLPNGEWQTPAGSFFTLAPLGAAARIAFVYPGAFNSYPGMGRGLFSLYPQVIDHLKTVTSDPWYTLRGDTLYPPDLDSMSPAEISEYENQMLADPVAMLSSGTTLSVALTWVLESACQITPQTAFGYSLGESSMLFSLGIWQAGDESMQALESSPVFRSRLAGRREAVTEAWKHGTSIDGSSPWENHFLMAPAEEVCTALDVYPHVYLTHINAPRQVVIGGDPQESRRLVSRLGCPALKAPFDHVLHCPPVESEIGRLAGLNDWPAKPADGIELLTADNFAVLPANGKAIAARIARMLTRTLDFPRLVEAAYKNGARVFIEVGPGANCTRWIDEILQGKPHLAVPSNRRGLPDQATLTRMRARLASHGIPAALRAAAC